MKKLISKIKSFLGKIKRRCGKYALMRVVVPNTYKKAAKAPVNPDKIVFVEVRANGISNSFSVMYDHLKTNYNYEIKTVFLHESSVPRKQYIENCKVMLREIATAKYVFLNEASNVFSSFKKRPETTVVQLWHGCGAFKKFGMATADLIFGESRKELLKFPYYRNQDIITTSSPEVEWAYDEAMNLPAYGIHAKGIGVSRTDVFYDESFKAAAYDRLYRLFPQAKGKKVILYAPTFRGRVAKAQTPDMLSVEMFYENLGDEYVLLIKHHPFVKNPPRIGRLFADFAQDMSKAMEIDELLCVADVCISDYSSLVYEYSLFEKPLIFFSYDLDEYFDWRGFFYKYDELAPGPIFTTNLEMIDYIKNVDERFDKARVHAFREKFMGACDGHATEKILLEMAGEEDLKKHKKAVPEPGNYHRMTLEETSRIKYKEINKDEAYTKAARAKLKEVLGDGVKDKIVVYAPKKRTRKLIPDNEVIANAAKLREYLKDDVTIAFLSDNENAKNKNDGRFEYLTPFINDVTGCISIPEAVAAADILIGDFDKKLIKFFGNKEKTIRYVPDYHYYINDEGEYMDDVEMPGHICMDEMQLIEKIKELI